MSAPSDNRGDVAGGCLITLIVVLAVTVIMGAGLFAY